MAASTIVRDTITDGAGGTVFNSALVNSAIYDNVDAMFSGAFTVGGLLSAEGFGTHDFSAGGTGGNLFQLRNTSAGTGNFAQLRLGNDARVDQTVLNALSSTWTTAAPNTQDGSTLEGKGPGGVSIAANNASGEIRNYAGGTTKLHTFDGDDIVLSGGVAGTQVLAGVLSGSVDTSQVGTDGDTAEKTLHTYTLPASSLDTDGQMIRYTIGGTVAGNANTKTLRFKFGTTTILTESDTHNGIDWHCEITIIRTGAATQKCIGTFWRGDALGTGPNTAYTTAAETLSGALAVEVTGQNGTASANDIVCELSYVELMR